MRIIFVSDRPSAPRALALPAAVLWGLPAFVLAVLLLAGLAGYRYAVAQVGQLPAELVEAWRGELRELHAQAVGSREQARREGQAYAARLAALQARLLRMEAVGQRLAGAAHLDAGEFDFDSEPALGGPMSPVAEAGGNEFSAALDRLAAQIEDRERQLSVMDSLLVDRRLQGEVALDGKPVAAGYLSSFFGRRTDPFSGKQAFHKGVDFTARSGTPVHAVASGVVTWAGWDKDYGRLIEIRHSDGYRTRYAHNSAILVKPGDVVEKGQAIARVGRTGRASGTHLHLEVLADGRLVDPLKYIGTSRTRR
jgi:murein DD-endopeptidase MepM/ murein hydrolase activator NlpD